jgi:hypothetical protein
MMDDGFGIGNSKVEDGESNDTDVYNSSDQRQHKEQQN